MKLDSFKLQTLFELKKDANNVSLDELIRRIGFDRFKLVIENGRITDVVSEA